MSAGNTRRSPRVIAGIVGAAVAAAALVIGIAAMIITGVPERTIPSIGIGLGRVDGRPTVLVPYTLEGSGGLVNLPRWIEVREETRLTAIDPAAGEQLWDTRVWGKFPAAERARVLTVGRTYAYLAYDGGLVILDVRTGDIRHRDGDIPGLDADYLASSTAYAFDPDRNVIVTLTAAGDVLMVDRDETTAEPASPAVERRWRDRLNLEPDDDGYLPTGERSRSVPAGRDITVRLDRSEDIGALLVSHAGRARRIPIGDRNFFGF